MADPFFYSGNEQDAIDDEDYLMSLQDFVLPPPQPAFPGSAFEAYQQRRTPALLDHQMGRRLGHDNSSGGGANVHRRMFGYLRRIDHRHDAAANLVHQPEEFDASPPRSSRFRHIMREQLRRERLSQGFADLHALLPPGASSRGGKNRNVGAAVEYIRELEGRKVWLRARNQELMQRAASASSRWSSGDIVVKVRAESEDHGTAVDVLEAVLRRLKAMEELRVTAIRSCFCAGGMWVDVGVEGHQVSTREVDKAITNALMELAGKELCKQGPGSRKQPSFGCQVESGVPMG